MPAGLPLTLCPPACLWLYARRPASDSSSPDCRWLKLAGLPLTHASWSSLAGKANSLPLFTPPSAVQRPRRSREITPPSVGKANPPSAAASSVAGKANPPSAVHSARSRLRLPPARRPLPLCGQARRLLPLLSSQPVMVSPAGRCRIDKPAGRGRNWPDGDHGLFNYCACVCLAPEGSRYPWATPWYFFGGGTKVPAVVAGPRDEATATMDHRPWPPELPAPPWPPSICSTLEVPSCVCIRVCPEGPPECPPPLPGGTVTARVEPSGRGELC